MSTKAIFETLLGALCVILNGLAESTVPRASFGETCGLNGTRCDSQSILTCVNDLCQCIKPNEMTFNKTQGKCLVLSGERCTYTAVEDSQEKKWTEKLDCVENAKCNYEGFCSCLQDYFEDSQGFCVRKRMNGQTCSKIEKCREDKYLVCVEGVCACNNTDTIFDSEQNKCVVRAGKSCSNVEPCVKNARCSGTESHSSDFRFSFRIGHNSNTQGKCICHDYLKTSETGLCLSRYSAGCNSQTTPCLEELACINGQCSCPFPEHQTYTKFGSNKCVSFVRGPCKENITGNILHYPCVSGAECQSYNGTDIHECQCSKGYVESDKKTCAIEYGENCETPMGKNPCDAVANLVCKNGKCVCPGFQVYNKNTLMCEGLVGAKCNLGEQFCVDGAYCHSYRDTKLGEGVCRCDSRWITDSNRKCIKA